MILTELMETEEYRALTQKQQLFVSTYCEGGLSTGVYDPVHATTVAYACKSPETARIMSYSVLANIRIIAVLNRHFKRDPIHEFVALLDRAIRNKNLSIAQVEVLRMKCQIMGFANKLPSRQTLVLPKDAEEKSKEARKAKRKKPTRKPKPEKAKLEDDTYGMF